ncbi:MAG: TolC family protein [candidate division Zixibacteria bacterium]|nr:TolC family protein [candidate division Zixibacteria bacterium]
MRLRFVIFLILLVPQWLWAEILTIDQAIDLALRNNESYQKVVYEEERANQKVIEAQASALPQFDASLTYLRNWELSSTVISFNGQPQVLKIGTNNNYTAGLTITQPIYVGGKVFTAMSIARQYRKFARQQRRMAEQELKLGVIKAYYGAVMADELLKVAVESESLATMSQNVVEKMFSQGLVSDYEVLRAKVRVANAKPATIQARAQAKLAHKNLNNLIGRPLDQTSELQFDMDSSIYDISISNLDSAKAVAISRRPEIEMNRRQTEMLKKAVSIAWGNWRPSIFFSTSLQYQAQSDRDRFPKGSDFLRSSYSAISIQVPIFDSWRTVAQAKQAKIDLAQSKLSQSELEDNIKLDVEQSWWNYRQARESLASQGQVVEMARRGLDIAKVRYENGVGTQLEMFDAEVALTSAETIRIQAFYNLVTGYASLKKALGEEDLLK